MEWKIKTNYHPATRFTNMELQSHPLLDKYFRFFGSAHQIFIESSSSLSTSNSQTMQTLHFAVFVSSMHFLVTVCLFVL